MKIEVLKDATADSKVVRIYNRYIYIMLYICYIYKYINLRAYAAYVIMLTYMNIYIYVQYNVYIPVTKRKIHFVLSKM